MRTPERVAVGGLRAGERRERVRHGVKHHHLAGERVVLARVPARQPAELLREPQALVHVLR